MIRYELAPDIDSKLRHISTRLQMDHIDNARIKSIISYGSKSKTIIARCHSLPKIMQIALNHKPHYIVEILSENFAKLSEENQTKVLIHELMHIPHSFQGGFRTHKPYVTKKKVERMYKQLFKNSTYS